MAPSEFASLFVRTFIIGIAVAAPVGAMGVLCIQRTLAGGWRAGVATGAGIATADGLYAAVAAFGVSALTSSIVALQVPLRIAGGVVLVWLGWRAWVSTPASSDLARALGSPNAGGDYATALALTLTNPMTIMAFGAVFASAGLGELTTLGASIVATLGVAAGSLAWWLALTSVVAVMRHAVSDRSVRMVNRVSGALVAILGVVAVSAGLAALAGA